MQKETFTTVLTTASALTVEFAREFVLDQMLDAISYDLEFDNQCGIEEMSWQHSLGGT